LKITLKVNKMAELSENFYEQEYNNCRKLLEIKHQTVCPKCSSTDLDISYKAPGEFVTSSWSKRAGKPDSEFLSYSEYDFFYKVTVKKEHLLKDCKTCHYRWREETHDSEEIK